VICETKEEWEYLVEKRAKRSSDWRKKIIEYYWQSAYRNIPGGNRNTYRIAAGYLAKGTPSK
jgi:hypothetical protein